MRSKKIISITLTASLLVLAINTLAYGKNLEYGDSKVGYGPKLEDKVYNSKYNSKLYYSGNSENKGSSDDSEVNEINEENIKDKAGDKTSGEEEAGEAKLKPAPKTKLTKAYGELTPKDILYNKAYDLTLKAVKEKSQSSINEARLAIEELSGKVDWAIGELSRQVDVVQHEILVSISEKIDIARIGQSQDLVNSAKSSITEDVPKIWKQGFDYEIDKIQQKIIYKTLEAVLVAKQSKTEEDINLAGQLISQLENIEGDEVVKSLIYKTKEDFLKFAEDVETKKPTDENKEKKKTELEEFLNSIKGYLSNKELKDLFEVEGLSLNKLEKYCKGERFFTILRNIVYDINKEEIGSKSYLEDIVEKSITKNILKDRLNKDGMNIEIEKTSKNEIDITKELERVFKGLAIDYSSIEYGECYGLIYENSKILLERDYLDSSVGIPIKLLEESEGMEKLYVTVTIKEDGTDEGYLERLISNVPKYMDVKADSKDLKEDIRRTIDSYLDGKVGIDTIYIIKDEGGNSLLQDINGAFKFNEKTYEDGRLGVQKVEIGIKSSKGNMVKGVVYLLLQPEVPKEVDDPLSQLYFAKDKDEWNELVGGIIKICGVRGKIDKDVIDRVGQYICYTTNWVNMKKLKEVVPKINGIFDLRGYYTGPIPIEINNNKNLMEKSLEEGIKYLKDGLQDKEYDYQYSISEDNKNNFITIEDNEIIMNKKCDMSYNVAVEKVALSIKASEDYKEDFEITFLFHKAKVSDFDRIVIDVKLYGDDFINDDEAKKDIRERLKEIGITFKEEFENEVLSYIKDTPNVKEKEFKEFIKNIDKDPEELAEFKELIKSTDWNKYKGEIKELEDSYENAGLDLSVLKEYATDEHFNYKKALIELSKKLKKEPLEDKEKTQTFIDEFINLTGVKIKLANNHIKLELKGVKEDLDISSNIKEETELEDIYDISEIEGVKYPIKAIEDGKIIVDKDWQGSGGFKILVKFQEGTYEKIKGKATPFIEIEIYLDITRKADEKKDLSKPPVEPLKKEVKKPKGID